MLPEVAAEPNLSRTAFSLLRAIIMTALIPAWLPGAAADLTWWRPMKCKPKHPLHAAIELRRLSPHSLSADEPFTPQEFVNDIFYIAVLAVECIVQLPHLLVGNPSA